MRSQPFTDGLLLTTAAAACALVLAGCGPAQPQTQETPTTSAGPTPSNSPTATPTTPPAPSPDPAPERCTSDSLTASTDATGGGAAGSVYMTLMLTNKGTEPCMLMGYPGVSLTATADGEPIGAPAVRDESKPPVELLLAPGEAGGAVLRYVQAGNYPDCTMADAAGYRIYPPEDFGSVFIPQPTTACSNAEIQLLTIGSFQPVG
ncbi:DUF4232 domain-containing protein [Pseudarthrobacter sp. J64]|uniref:DUF4232 domain-containing protein n=1 Tax=Pseudarthrobacter sp. J64 TaxID=3116485 RepID=UPI002E817467|nr:DUF4232 domain-containing protein [Pseudarthrobacter sp. J64]MEE2570967.1 DUF4232 domain-containing protein [Pseudarthrobacter sp. J64]